MSDYEQETLAIIEAGFWDNFREYNDLTWRNLECMTRLILERERDSHSAEFISRITAFNEILTN